MDSFSEDWCVSVHAKGKLKCIHSCMCVFLVRLHATYLNSEGGASNKVIKKGGGHESRGQAFCAC